MATYKGVFFCESDKEKWFDNRADAERFDRASEVAKYVDDIVFSSPGYVREVVDCIMKRYEIMQRWDYEADHEAEDVQE